MQQVSSLSLDGARMVRDLRIRLCALMLMGKVSAALALRGLAIKNHETAEQCGSTETLL